MQATTAILADWASRFDTSALRDRVIARAQHAILDWVGVTVAGSTEPLVTVLAEDATANESAGSCTLVGRTKSTTATSAALVNGAASHALDFDDVNRRLRGHPTVAVLPAVLACAEQQASSGRELIDAFVVGYEVACALGEAMGRGHYESGWHATATVGTLGAAAGVARLLRLRPEQCAHALGIASTQAAGIKAMFGTQCKPLHAGKAAMNGLLSARWASRGLDANPAAIEAHQGFAATHNGNLTPLSLPDSGDDDFAVESGLYKFHAACFLTHASIDGIRSLFREHALGVDQIAAVTLQVPAAHRDVCDIMAPQSGLQVKFSIRHLAAMACHGLDTSSLELYSDATASDEGLVDFRERVTLDPDNSLSRWSARVRLILQDGRELERLSDAGQPIADDAEQKQRLEQKFARLVDVAYGAEQRTAIAGAIDSLPAASDVFKLTSLLRTSPG